MSFGKHFASMYSGSLVGSGAIVFAIMGYVIANFRIGRDGVATVELNPKLLGPILGESVDDVLKGIEKLCDRDPDSRTQVEEGRRLVRLGQFDYRVVNGAAYRGMRDEDDRKLQNREAQRRFRAKKGVENGGGAKMVEGISDPGSGVKRRGRPAKNPLPGERAYEKAALAGDEKEMERVLESRLPVDPNIAAKALVAEAKGVMREIRAERRAENKEEKASEAEAFRQRTLAKMAEAAKAELPPEPEGLPAEEQPAPGVIPEL